MCSRVIIIALLYVVFTGATVWCAPVTVYVAEFTVNGADKQEQIKSTIQTLLLSRLSGENIRTVNKADGAVFSVSGSYLLSGAMFSIDAEVTDAAGTVLFRAYAQGKHPGELISETGTLAKTLSEGFFQKTALMGTIQADGTMPDMVKTPKKISAADKSIHVLAGAMRGLAIGRLLPGGERELFVVGNHVLRYYRAGSELKLMAEISYKIHENVLAVDTADLDNDKDPEVYVTITNGEELISQMWHVEGASLKLVAGQLPYYFRAVIGAGGVKKLYAQQRSGSADFIGDVAEVVRSGNSVALAKPVKLPKQGYLYNFTMIKAGGNEPGLLLADRSGYLKVYSPKGEELWKSDETYSGSETSFKRSDYGASGTGGYRQVFLDQRMIATASGDVLVPKNVGSWFLFDKHSYSRNTLHCFFWNGTDLQEKWRTRQSDFYLADFAYDESSRELLVLEVVTKEEGVFDKGASRLVIRKID